jgi:hypothetical protein
MTSTVPKRDSSLYVVPREAAQLLGILVNPLKRIPPDDLPFFRIGTRGDRRYDRLDVEQYRDQRQASS